jgi:hypothetical protein
MHAKTISVNMSVKNKYPGAGTYDLQHLDNKSMRNAPKFSMGKETRAYDPHAKEQKHKPGAGTHELNFKLKKSSPAFGFGTSKRPEVGYKKTVTPAPGHYKVPARIADVHSHTQAKGHADFHYV